MYSMCVRHSSRWRFEAMQVHKFFFDTVDAVCASVCMYCRLASRRTHFCWCSAAVSMANKPVPSRLVSAFLLLQANHRNCSLPLMSLRIQHVASCQMCCLLLFLHLNPLGVLVHISLSNSDPPQMSHLCQVHSLQGSYTFWPMDFQDFSMTLNQISMTKLKSWNKHEQFWTLCVLRAYAGLYFERFSF